MSKRYYAAIGSRIVPDEIKVQMKHLAREFETLGYTQRTGDAVGSDEIFREAAIDVDVWCAHIKKKFKDDRVRLLDPFDEEAFTSVDKFHPVGTTLVPYIKAIHARNYRQVIGRDEPNSEFVVCWTWDGDDTGGTGQAMRVAKHFGIPVFNIFYESVYIDLLNKIKLEQQFG